MSTHGDPVMKSNDGKEWGFWDEAWANWYGGYSSEEEARKGFKDYCERFLNERPIRSN